MIQWYKFRSRIVVWITLTMVIVGLFSHNSIVSDIHAQANETGVNELIFNNPYGLPETPQGGRMLHAWSMRFNDIRAILPEIAQAGFNTIQTSPIGNSLFQFPAVDEAGNPTGLSRLIGTWWMLYQPTRFQIGNLLGTEAEFRALAREAAALGIFIIVDAVPNHTTSWWGEIHPELRRPELFHAVPNDRSQWDRNVANWNNRAESTRARLLGLVDFKTSSPEFQQLYTAFLARKMDAGASGFRYDAMVHIESPNDPEGVRSNFWTVTNNFVRDYLHNLGRPSFQYGEVLGNASRQRIYLRDLAPDIAVTPYEFSAHIRSSAIMRTNNSLDTGVNNGWDSLNFHIPEGSVEGSSPNGPAAVASRMVPWVESHDQYGNDGVSRRLTPSQIEVGWALIAAREGVTPLFFVRPGEGFVNDGQMFVRNEDGTHTNVLGHSNHFTSPTISAINWFANAFIGQPERLTTHDSDLGNNIAMIERGEAGQGNKTGAVIAVTGTQPLTHVALATYLRDGDYFDHISGRTYQVNQGVLTGPPLRPRSVVVLRSEPHPQQSVQLNAEYESLEITGPQGLEITLVAVNTQNQRYSITKGDKTLVRDRDFNDLDKIIIGENANANDVFVLTLTAQDKQGQPLSTSVTFTRRQDPIPLRLEFKTDLPWTQVGVWTWARNIANGPWPGTDNRFVWDDDLDVWVFTFPLDWEEGVDNLIIHNGEGTAQTEPIENIVESERITFINGVLTRTPLSQMPQPLPWLWIGLGFVISLSVVTLIGFFVVKRRKLAATTSIK